MHAYKLLAPRPVWLVTTVDAKGRINAAPFSFVMPVEFDPPLVSFACGREHHTYKNIAETKEFVINIPSASLKKQILVCGKAWPVGVNELEKAGLKWAKAKKVKPPLVKECPINLECILKEIREGEHCLVIGEVVEAHFKKEVFNGKVNLKNFKPLMHLGGIDFATADEI